MKSTFDAAKDNEIVDVRVCLVNEKILGKKNTAALELVMKASQGGEELDKWLNHVLWGTEKGSYFHDRVTGSLTPKVNVVYDKDGGWSYEDSLIGAVGQAVLRTNDKGYPEIDSWVPPSAQVPTTQPKKEESTLEDDLDVPF